MLIISETEEVAAIALAHRDKKPFMNVTLLGNEYCAFLDTGSSVSVLGDDIIPVIEQRGIKCRKNKKAIRFLKGTYQATKSVILTVNFHANSRKHSFLLVPGTIKTILLGLYFLGPANIGVFIGLGGWTIGLEAKNVIPFAYIKYEFLVAHELSSQAFANVLRMEEYSCPAEILANWNYVDEDEPKQEVVKEISLFPETEWEQISAPAFLNEDQISNCDLC